MRNPVIYAQFHDLRVNQQEFHLVRLSLVKYARNQCIDTDAFAAARRPRNQQMRHFGNIRNNRVSGNILTQRERQPRRMFLERFAFQHCPQVY